MALLFNNLFKGSKPENGELTINLNLTIKIEADGSFKVTPTVAAPPEPAAVLHKKEDVTPPQYEIPEWDVNEGNLINFGKNV